MASTTMIQMDHWTNSQAALSDAEKTSINALTNWLTSDMSLSSKQEEANGSNSIGGGPSRPTTASSIGVAGPSLPSAPLTDAPSYLSWYSKQQTHISSSTQNSHSRALQSLSHAADRADVLLDHLEAARVHIAELRAGARFVEEGSEGLREEAETMMERIDHLSQLSQALALRLSYFAILPASTSFLSSPSLSLVTSTDFLFTLDRLDVALAFVDAHPHYRDSPLYKMRFEHCVLRAGTLIRMYTLTRWKELVHEVGVKLRAWEKSRETKGKEKETQVNDKVMMYLAEPLVSSLLWDRFEEEEPSLRPLLAELEKRASLLAAPASTDVEIYGSSNNNMPTDEKSLLADYTQEGNSEEKQASTMANLGIFRSPEFVTLLSECRVAYFEARRSLLGAIISNCLAQIEVSTASESSVPSSLAKRASTPLASFIRRSLTFLSAVCEREVSLFSDFFTVDQESNSNTYKDLPNYIQSLCTLLDDRIRSRLLKETDLSSISAACLALVGDEQLEEASSTVVYSNLSIIVLKEAQDRLSSRARQDLSGPQFALFNPKEEDLDYPAKIRKSQSHRRAQSSIGGAGLLEAALDVEASSHRGFLQVDAIASPGLTSSVRLFTSPPKSIVSSWYPPLASTLSLLSTTNDALPTEEFVDLAYSAINTCQASISKAGDLMSSQGGFGAGRIGLSGRMDVPLFLLRHYFLLREILASVELRKASGGNLQVDRRVAGASNSLQANGTGGTIIDFAKLVEALNSIWTGIRGYGTVSKQVVSVEEPIMEEESVQTPASSTSFQQRQLEANVTKASEQFIDVVFQSITLPLRVYMDQRSRASRARASLSYTMSPTLTSPGQEPKSPPPVSPGPTTTSPLKKIRSAVQAFEKCAETHLKEANDAMRLYLEDDRAISSLADPINERIMNTFITFVTTVETSGISLDDIPELKKADEQKVRLAAAFH